jgi:alpha-galactosidase
VKRQPKRAISLSVSVREDKTGLSASDPGIEHLLHLQAGGVSLVIDTRGPRIPRIVHWGAALGAVSPAVLADIAFGSVPPRVSSVPDDGVVLGLLPEHSGGWSGEPGLTGHRQGRAWSPLFTMADLSLDTTALGSQCLVATCLDAVAGLRLIMDLELTESGVVRLRGRIHNDADTDYTVDAMGLGLPVPSEANELLDLTGRHLRERSPQRQPFNVGTRVREGRRGRTGLDATLLMVAGNQGFSNRSGEVWGVHVAWSGNHRTYAERLPNGQQLLGGGELLLPGEICLGPGDDYQGPWLYASYGAGLDELSGRIHQLLRARGDHPGTPRPVVLNTWEAVYFDHDLPKLNALVDAAAEVGVERFVLDDGWFRNRRDDRSGLGDWFVDESVWPNGLHDLVRHVRGRAMQFGLWVEPEMINPASDLARAHPDWIMATGGRLPIEWRYQQVLDLTHPEAYDYILRRLDSLVSEYGIDYLKWDHNRDLIDGGNQPSGEPVVHRQTQATYRLIDELRMRHPALEIESCASGGGRVDLGILERTDRVWASDCNDALERQSINRWTQLLLPPELLGAHIGPERSHTTGRRHEIDFRAGTALFGHFGIEMDLTITSAADLQRLAEWVALYKRIRPLLHSGKVVWADHPDPALLVHGVVAQDRSEAVFGLVAVATSVVAPPGRVRLPGLKPDALYRVRPLPPGDVPRGINHVPAPWIEVGRVTVTGAALERIGLQAPDLYPEHLFLLHLAETDGKAG